MDQTTEVERLAGGGFEGGKSISPDVVLSAVAHDHRRSILRSLNDADGEELAVDALVDRVTERVRIGDAPGDTHRERVHIGLQHTHLPKLHDAGLIVYDTETKQVRDSTGELSAELLSVIAPFDAPE